MKIIYFSNATIPSRTANTVHIMKMCQAFSKNGHDVLLLVRKKMEQEDDKLYSYYGVSKCFRIEQVEAKNSFVYGLKGSLVALKKKPDLVYGRFITGCFFCSLFSMKSIWESHAPIRNIPRFFARLFARFVFSQFQQIVVISKALKDYYVDYYGYPEKKIKVAHDAADEPIYKNIITFDKTVFNLHVGYIGHLYPGKGMEIISELIPKCPWAFFHIIGGTEQDIKLWNEKLKQQNNVKFYGFMPYSETEKYRISFDVLLAPYLKKIAVHGGKGDIGRWISPLKLFEYMAVCKPIITSSLPTMKEVLENQETALLCDPDDIESWINALKKIRDYPDIAKQMATNAYNLFKNKYTWKIRANQVLNI